MTQYPTFNFKTVYFFIMSLFGIVFIFSLTDLFSIPNRMAITIISIINVFLGITAWIIDERYDRDFPYQKKGHLHTKEERLDLNRNKFYNLIVVTVCTFLFTILGIALQLIE